MSLCIVRVNFWAKEGKQLPSGWVCHMAYAIKEACRK
jgi:hypothetical protein